jgi:hypothetical protein
MVTIALVEEHHNGASMHVSEVGMRPWLSVAVAVVVAAGCGAAAAATPAAAVPARAGPAGRARVLADHLVAQMALPPGTKPASLSSVPSALRDPGPSGPGWFAAERLLVAPARPAAVLALLLAHKPFGTSGTAGVAGGTGATGSDVLLPAPEPGVAAAEAAVWLEPWHSGTLIAAYGFATWLPVRTAAEHLNPASFRAVTISATTIVSHLHTVTRTFTSARAIARITAFLNARPAAPELALPCPLPVTSYQATLTPVARGGPVVIVSPFCLTDQITVNGTSQPLLWDTSDELGTILGSLLSLKPRS